MGGYLIANSLMQRAMSVGALVSVRDTQAELVNVERLTET